jgi:hypothetical protein
MSKKPDQRAYQNYSDYSRAEKKYKHDIQKGAQKNYAGTHNYGSAPSQKDREKAEKKAQLKAQKEAAEIAMEREQAQKEAKVKFDESVKKAQNQELKAADELLNIGLGIFCNVSNANLGKPQSEFYYKFSCDILKYAFLFGKQESTSYLEGAMPSECKDTKEMLDKIDTKAIDTSNNGKYVAYNKAMQVIKYNGAMYGNIVITDSMKLMALSYFNRALEDIGCGKYKLPHDLANPANSTAARTQTEVKVLEKDGVTYGKISTQNIKIPAFCKVNGTTVTIEEYRSVNFPDSMQPGKEWNIMRAIKTLDGKELSKDEADCLKIQYDTKGKLIYLSTPGKLYIPDNPNDPALVVHKKQVCTLPVSGVHYKHLADVVRQNSGKVVQENNDSIPFAGSMPEFAYLPPNDHNILTITNRTDQFTEIKVGNEVLGVRSEAMVKSAYKYKLNEKSTIVVHGYRSVTLPDSIKPSTNDCLVKLPLKTLNGSDIKMEGNAYFGVEYNAAGKLSKLYTPTTPTIPKESRGYHDKQNIDEPALISYKGQICTLPVSAGYFSYLGCLVDMYKNYLVTPVIPSKIIITEKDTDFGSLELIGSSSIGNGDNENCIIS